MKVCVLKCVRVKACVPIRAKGVGVFFSLQCVSMRAAHNLAAQRQVWLAPMARELPCSARSFRDRKD
jgi:hypothetical protein